MNLNITNYNPNPVHIEIGTRRVTLGLMYSSESSVTIPLESAPDKIYLWSQNSKAYINVSLIKQTFPNQNFSIRLFSNITYPPAIVTDLNTIIFVYILDTGITYKYASNSTVGMLVTGYIIPISDSSFTGWVDTQKEKINNIIKKYTSTDPPPTPPTPPSTPIVLQTSTTTNTYFYLFLIFIILVIVIGIIFFVFKKMKKKNT